MQALLSLLDPPHATLIQQVWQELEQYCGMTGVKVTPFPHFSWLLAEAFERPALERVLGEISAEVRPFTVRASGLAIFTGENPIVYLPLVRTAELSRLHQRVWDRLSPLGTQVSPHYAPPSWMPHITIGFGDVTQANLACVLERLASRSFDWEIKIDNFSLGFQSAGAATLIARRYELNP